MANSSSASALICGFDVGSENCFIAVARAGGIEILLNEYSQRSTPAYIAFGDNQRELGVSAKQKQMMNLSNTCFAPNRIIGKQMKEMNEDLAYQIEPSSTGEVAVRVWHNGEEHLFNATQIMAMLFTKLRQVSGNSIDCVINCPVFFTDSQRRSLIDAAMIAGLNPIRIIPDMTAISLYYGFYRTAPSTQEVVAFVDSGHTSTQCAVVLFNNKENYVKVLSLEYEANLGGKHFDELLANYFIEEQKLKLNKRAKFRLIAECEKLKKQMSANSNELPINIECLYDEKDFSGRMDRVLFEQLADNLFKKVEAVFHRALNSASDKFTTDTNGALGEFKIDAVEIVGGTSRIPAIKRLVKSVFGVEATTTLNADEAVARGCALQCAMLSPSFKVAREIQLIDFAPYQIDFRYWHLSPTGTETDFKSVRSLFPRGHPLPFTKQISINCQSLPIIVAFDYINDSNQTIPIGEFKITSLENIQITKNQMKLRVRLDPNGLVVVHSATVLVGDSSSKKNTNNTSDGQIEDIEMTNPSQDQNSTQPQSMETDQPAAPPPATGDQKNDATNHKEDGEQEKKPRKSKATSYDLQVETLWIRGKLPDAELQKLREVELNLILADKNWKEKIDSKNALEEYIYEWRDKLEGGGFDPFIGDEEKQNFLTRLQANEQWLYEQEDNGEIHSKSVYEERLVAMKDQFSKGIVYREQEFRSRPSLLELLGQRLQQSRKIIESAEEAEAEAIHKLKAEVLAKQKWLDDAFGTLQSTHTSVNPPITCEQIKQQTDSLDSLIRPIYQERQRRIDEKKKQAEAAANKQPPPPPPEQQPTSQPTDTPNDVPPPMEVDPDVHPTI